MDHCYGWKIILLGVHLTGWKILSPLALISSRQGRGKYLGEIKGEIKILTSKLISDIKCRCKDRFEKEGNNVGKRGSEVV
jgi:hypothetical protein